ncbi:MAG: DUF177 domain-containing protein [Clostridiales bacterium]|nr:DUF177 domain-containing protein [Clostridiales bacterium]
MQTMRIDMRALLAGETNRIVLDRTFSLEDGDYAFDTHIDGVTLTTPVKVTGEIVNMGGYICLKARAEVEYDTECARCLEPLHRSLTVELERTVVNHGSLENTSDEDADDYLEIVDGELDIETTIAEELMMNFPIRELCSENCKGLCPKCGKNLNEGECGCVTKEIDPRLAILQKLLEKE